MEFKDLIITPFYLMIIFFLAYVFRSSFTNKLTKRYFFPALIAKIVGALSLGIIYQFYYGMGDTFSYHTQAGEVYKAFSDSVFTGIRLLFSSGKSDASLFKYSSKMYWSDSPPEFFVIKIAAVFAVLSFNTYSVIAIFFSIFSFAGSWALYNTLLKLYPQLYKELAYSILFLPSVIFWGSGLMKDTVCFGALGLLFYSFYFIFVAKRKIISNVILCTIMIYIIQKIKLYIILAFLPGAILWIFLENSDRIKSKFWRTASKPLFIVLGLGIGNWGASVLMKNNLKYDIENIAYTTKVNSEYIYKVSLAQQGSAYYIGDFDGSLYSLIKVLPQAINVGLFRPYLFEAKNPLILLSSLEATFFLLLTLSTFFKIGFFKSFKFIFSTPFLSFSFLFSLIFAAAVGMNSFNFGTLVRYRIPCLPFYLACIIILRYIGKLKTKKIQPQQANLQ